MRDSTLIVHLIDYSGAEDHALQEALVSEGFEVRTLPEDQANLRSSRQNSPDVILLCLGGTGARGMARPGELRRAVAQVRAFQRLKSGSPFPQVPRLQLLPGSRAVRVNGDTISVTDAEFDLLGLLAEQAGQAVSRDDICRQIRGLDHDDRDRTIDLRIARLRRKLGDNPRQPTFIRTVRGEGYMLMVDEA